MENRWFLSISHIPESGFSVALYASAGGADGGYFRARLPDWSAVEALVRAVEPTAYGRLVPMADGFVVVPDEGAEPYLEDWIERARRNAAGPTGTAHLVVAGRSADEIEERLSAWKRKVA